MPLLLLRNVRGRRGLHLKFQLLLEQRDHFVKFVVQFAVSPLAHRPLRVAVRKLLFDLCDQILQVVGLSPVDRQRSERLSPCPATPGTGGLSAGSLVADDGSSGKARPGPAFSELPSASQRNLGNRKRHICPPWSFGVAGSSQRQFDRDFREAASGS